MIFERTVQDNSVLSVGGPCGVWFTVLEPLYDLVRVQLLEFLAGIKIVVLAVTIWTVKFGLEFGLHLYRLRHGCLFPGHLFSYIEAHSR